jgi:hypothetical protein
MSDRVATTGPFCSSPTADKHFGMSVAGTCHPRHADMPDTCPLLHTLLPTAHNPSETMASRRSCSRFKSKQWLGRHSSLCAGLWLANRHIAAVSTSTRAGVHAHRPFQCLQQTASTQYITLKKHPYFSKDVLTPLYQHSNGCQLGRARLLPSFAGSWFPLAPKSKAAVGAQRRCE